MSLLGWNQAGHSRNPRARTTWCCVLIKCHHTSWLQFSLCCCCGRDIITWHEPPVFISLASMNRKRVKRPPFTPFMQSDRRRTELKPFQLKFNQVVHPRLFANLENILIWTVSFKCPFDQWWDLYISKSCIVAILKNSACAWWLHSHWEVIYCLASTVL